MKNEQHLLNKQELAERLGASKRGVEELMKKRKIPYFAWGHRTVRFDWEAVQKALARFEHQSVGGKTV